VFTIYTIIRILGEMDMKENRKGLIIAIIVLLIGASVVPNISGVIETDSKEINEENIHIENLFLDTEMFYPTDDSDIKQRHPNDNYGSDSSMLVSNRYGSSSSDWEADALVRFDLSSIPSGIISSASLNLYYCHYYDTDPVGRGISCYKIASDWGEHSVTWNDRPSYASTVTSYATLPSNFGWVTWDVTNDVQDFVGTETNYGWWIMDENYWGNSNIPQSHYRAKEPIGNEFSPYLEVETLEPHEPHMAFLFGRIENLNTAGDLIIFDAVKLRYLQFSPFSFNTYISGEEIAVVGSGLGIITTSFAFGFFSATIL